MNQIRAPKGAPKRSDDSQMMLIPAAAEAEGKRDADRLHDTK